MQWTVLWIKRQLFNYKLQMVLIRAKVIFRGATVISKSEDYITSATTFLLKSEVSVLIKCDSYCKGDDYCDRKLNRWKHINILQDNETFPNGWGDQIVRWTNLATKITQLFYEGGFSYFNTIMNDGFCLTYTFLTWNVYSIHIR